VSGFAESIFLLPREAIVLNSSNLVVGGKRWQDRFTGKPNCSNVENTE